MDRHAVGDPLRPSQVLQEEGEASGRPQAAFGEPRNDCDVGGETPKQTAEVAMPKPSPRQRKTMGRVMHEFKHGELKSGPGGKAGKVRSRRQAIAIALKEAGASNTRASARTGATSPSPSARRRAATLISRSAKASRTWARAAGGKAAPPWAERTPRARPRRARRACTGPAGRTKEQLYRGPRRGTFPAGRR